MVAEEELAVVAAVKVLELFEKVFVASKVLELFVFVQVRAGAKQANQNAAKVELVLIHRSHRRGHRRESSGEV